MIDVLLGLQYGDEGKGKIVDTLTPNYDIVARFQGGCNAGHTLVFNGNKHVLHLIPSGIFHDCVNIIGNGCVIDPVSLKNEIEVLEKMGVDVKSKLIISKKAHITLPLHKYLDRKLEEAKGNNKIGSTLKGIGPTYTSKFSREGFRMLDIGTSVDIAVNFTMENCMGPDIVGTGTIKMIYFEEYVKFLEALLFLKNYKIQDTEIYLNNAIKNGKKVLAEGAQGTLLDVDFGSYPFVTSSNTSIGGVMTGLGIPPQCINNVIGITKAYATRVGSGPFNSELNGEDGKKLRKIGNEFGSTTGRPRRCGWLDMSGLAYTCMINGVTELNLMKLDVLSEFDKIQIYFNIFENDVYIEDNLIDTFVKKYYTTLNRTKYFDGEFVEFDGWNIDISHIRKYEDLPENCKKYIEFIQQCINIPITKISVGPDRDQLISKNQFMTNGSIFKL